MARGAADRIIDAVDLRLAALVSIGDWIEKPEELRALRLGYMLGFGDGRENPHALAVEADALRAEARSAVERLRIRAEGSR